MAVADVFKLMKESDVKFVDLRFTDTRGKEQHVTVPAHVFGQDKFDDGHAFDGSSIAGWKGIQASDMLRRDRTCRRQGLRPRSALHCKTRRGVPEIQRHR
jgi:glutamine synthetase